MLFNNRTCWITGASSGIGEALAYQLAKEGAKLILSSNQPDELARVKEACLKHTESCQIVPFDLASPDEVQLVATRTVDEFGPIYLLINNGGISQRALAKDTPLDLDRKIMEIDFFSYLIITKAVIPGMINKGEGYIAATSSISGKFGFPLRSTYAAAKHAIQGYFETLRLELMPHGISVTLAYPGRVSTNISLHALKNDGSEHGQMDSGQAGGISATQCAKEYIAAIKRKKPEVLIGGKELLMVHIKRLWPWLFFKLVQKIKPT